MTIELKTGKKGELHISSEDDRLLHCRSFGTGAYVLSGCAVTMTSANKAHIAEGELMVQGGYVRITGGGEDVDIANGVAGQKRNTVITLNYTRDQNGIEAMSFAAVDGTSTEGTPSDPAVTTNDINTGASSSMWKFARIQLDGLTVGTPQVLFTTKTAALLDQISSLSSQISSLRDSVSPTASEYWTVLNLGGTQIAWIIVGTNSGPVVPGSNMIARKLPFTPKANNAVNVLASLIGTGAANVDNFTDVDLLPSVNGNTLTVNAYNSGQHTVVNASISILVLERLKY